MRDYVDLMARLSKAGGLLAQEAAEAIRELKVIADRMTNLGADLEEQVQEQLEATFFWDAAEKDGYGFESVEHVLERYARGEIARIHRAHDLPDTYAVTASDNTILYGDSEDDVRELLEQYEAEKDYDDIPF